MPLFKCSGCRSFFSRLDFQEQTPRDIHADSIQHYLVSEVYIINRVRGLLTYACDEGWRASAAGDRLLDIGCGVGWSLIPAAELGFTAVGVEPLPAAAEYATQTLGVDVINALFTRELFAADTFDFVILDQVLEHVPVPLSLFGDIVHVLKPGGLLFLGVPPIDWTRKLVSASLHLSPGAVTAPNGNGLGRATALLRKHDSFASPEGHINYFSAAAIEVLAAKCGAEVLGQYHAQRWRSRMFPALHLSTGSFFLRKR